MDWKEKAYIFDLKLREGFFVSKDDLYKGQTPPFKFDEKNIDQLVAEKLKNATSHAYWQHVRFMDAIDQGSQLRLPTPLLSMVTDYASSAELDFSFFQKREMPQLNQAITKMINELNFL